MASLKRRQFRQRRRSVTASYSSSSTRGAWTPTCASSSRPTTPGKSPTRSAPSKEAAPWARWWPPRRLQWQLAPRCTPTQAGGNMVSAARLLGLWKGEEAKPRGGGGGHWEGPVRSRCGGFSFMRCGSGMHGGVYGVGVVNWHALQPSDSPQASSKRPRPLCSTPRRLTLRML